MNFWPALKLFSNSKKHTKADDQGKKFECVKCMFTANSIATLDVHILRNHDADIVNCGLWEKTFEKKVNLETHLNTCEIYTCNKWKKKEKTIPSMKYHVINVHESEKNLMIDNFKLSRYNSEEFTCKNFSFQFWWYFIKREKSQIKHAFFLD